MKRGTVFVLVAFIILGMASAQKHHHKGPHRPGVCPKVPKGTIGACVDMCSGDKSCPKGMKCCSNGCGHDCQPAIRVNEFEDTVEEKWGV